MELYMKNKGKVGKKRKIVIAHQFKNCVKPNYLNFLSWMCAWVCVCVYGCVEQPCVLIILEENDLHRNRLIKIMFQMTIILKENDNGARPDLMIIFLKINKVIWAMPRRRPRWKIWFKRKQVYIDMAKNYIFTHKDFIGKYIYNI